ncbi:hypothetical protein J1G44_02040 [Cellulomonas sp. zg-ZUI199]|uniref:Uncharacterized protein n=1 Tax=Cellulomonas wangleii TaxID=2816956 RepID=A0ABX8D6E1_9CELL|nr:MULTISPECIES: hypothetical protein [Cellulomonas]MBO0899455.1 hypothetical protein [Cellulomonas sp. zg-ZUI22]MBO0923262.1 hypothetical protein [Cellulomonas wangleii]QVI61622.1 hypothetical protein KG103_14325 [Cellulomonas wangleii]
MRSSASDGARGGGLRRGTRVRLGLLLLLVAAGLVAQEPGMTRALMTDTDRLTTVVSTRPDFPSPTPTPAE